MQSFNLNGVEFYYKYFKGKPTGLSRVGSHFYSTTDDVDEEGVACYYVQIYEDADGIDEIDNFIAYDEHTFLLTYIDYIAGGWRKYIGTGRVIKIDPFD